jgi:hypothetical protein
LVAGDVAGQPELNRLLRGALAGAAATLGMSAFMFLGRRAGLLGRMPPEKITSRLLGRAGLPRTRRQQDVAASALHLGFGAAAGALFSPLRARLPVNPILAGVAYGTAVWAVSYMGWVPGLGIMPPPSRDRPGRPETMLAAHWVYGALLGAAGA